MFIVRFLDILVNCLSISLAAINFSSSAIIIADGKTAEKERGIDLRIDPKTYGSAFAEDGQRQA